jgi:hypothetical protein
MHRNTQEEKHDQLDELGREKLVPFKLSALCAGGEENGVQSSPGSVVSPISELDRKLKSPIRGYAPCRLNDATHALNLSAWVSNAKVLGSRSFS